MFNRNASMIAALLAASASIAIACGPDFPWQLLADRAATLRATPINSFTHEASLLVPVPKDTMIASSRHSGARNNRAEFERIDQEGLGADEIDALRAARAAVSGEAALAAGARLPAAIRLYTAGAVAWHRNDLAFAGDQFQSVLALPEPDRASREVWAAYMLGRVNAATGDPVAAANAFAQTRQLVLLGLPDPFELGIASLGEEAQLHFRRMVAAAENIEPPREPQASTDLRDPDEPGPERDERSPSDLATFRDALHEATRLYAEQAARGAAGGVSSLRIVAEYLLASPARIDAAASEPLAQKLLVSYVVQRLHHEAFDTIEDVVDARDGSYRDARSQTVGALGNLIAALEREPDPAGADRLAALCYSLGRWSCAERLAAKTQSPLAAWIGAKLALRDGDVAQAASLYAKATHGFPEHDLDPELHDRLLGEGALVALARSDYVDALDQLMPVASRYWLDVAYIAERVLTIDELRSYVDAQVSKVGPAPEQFEYGYRVTDARASLRDLLARRLMREGQARASLAYFTSAAVRDQAVAYEAAMQQAERARNRIDRAEALFKAATLARRSGMAMMGTEDAPDSHFTQGNFESTGDRELRGTYVTTDERRRFAASVAEPSQRFHYRYVAIDATLRAADLVPARSQAFAAMLCHAWRWSSRDEARAAAIYRRYLKEGPYVPWAAHFGTNCPAPDFNSAQTLERKIRYTNARRYWSRHRWWVLGGGIAAIGATTVFILALRRRSPRDPRSVTSP